jgi:hypothetical protein
MNYIVSSIILLVIIMIIIYILSIDNNMYKLKNKCKEMFKVAGSKDISYINENDSYILLQFLKGYYNMYDNIMIPKKIYYTKDENNYIMKEVNIIGYKLGNDNMVTNKNHIINIKFTPIKNDLFIGQFSLFGINGNYYVENIVEEINNNINNNSNINNNINNNNNNNNINTIKNQINEKTIQNKIYSDIVENNINTINSSDMIPDIIHITSDIEEDSDIVTTVTPSKKINHVRFA